MLAVCSSALLVRFQGPLQFRNAGEGGPGLAHHRCVVIGHHHDDLHTHTHTHTHTHMQAQPAVIMTEYRTGTGCNVKKKGGFRGAHA